jgi:hypothetical protein
MNIYTSDTIDLNKKMGYYTMRTAFVVTGKLYFYKTLSKMHYHEYYNTTTLQHFPRILREKMKKILLMMTIFVYSCAHAPIPDDSCASALSKVNAPDVEDVENVERFVHRACEYFEKKTGYTPDVSDVTVTLAASETSRAILKRNPDIYVNYLSDEWERELMHEVWHVLLWRNEPEVHTSSHHETMLQYRLCYPIQLCGYGHDYSEWK